MRRLEQASSVDRVKRFAIVAVLVLASTRAWADDATPTTGDDEGEATAKPVTRGTEKGTLGLGLILGEPTGVTARLYLADDVALQASAGFAFFGSGFQLTTDYCIHPYVLPPKPEYVIATYIGAGLRAIDYSKHDEQFLGLGIRAVGGLLFDFQIPIDAFVEVAGVFEYKFGKGDDRGFGIGINAVAGARYYF